MIKRFTRKQIDATARMRPKGYVKELESIATKVTDDWVEINVNSAGFKAMQAKYRTYAEGTKVFIPKPLVSDSKIANEFLTFIRPILQETETHYYYDTSKSEYKELLVEFQKTGRPFISPVDMLLAIYTVGQDNTVDLKTFFDRVEECQSRCEFAKHVDGDVFCGVCGCENSKNMSKTFNLAKYVETEHTGCKHPFRGTERPDGSTMGWNK